MTTLTVLQLNAWMSGTMVPDGINRIAQIIKGAAPEIVGNQIRRRAVRRNISAVGIAAVHCLFGPHGVGRTKLPAVCQYPK